MGGRGSFVSVETGNFAFKDGGQTYFVIGRVGEVEILERPKTSVKAPEYSHSASRIYAIVKNGKLKHLAYYDENHNQIKSVDFGHEHGRNRLNPHVHFNRQHIKNEPGTPPTDEDLHIAEQVREWLKKQKGK